MKHTDPLSNIAHNHNPFIVPEGYFQSFPDRIMNTITREDKKKKHRHTVRMFQRWTVAAMFVGAMGIVGFSLWQKPNTETLAEDQETEYIDDALDYTMVDNHDIENYLTENY